MTEKEISELYARLSFQYESGIDILLAKRMIDADLAAVTKERFYNSLNEEKLRTSNDYVFQGKSLSNVVEDYNKNVNNNVYKEEEKIKNGKFFYDCLRHELHQIRKDEVELIQIIVEYLFANQNTEIEELAKFLEKELSATR